jgi:DNA-directed RNA polymerase subunit RPC12/RpoP
VKEDATVDVRGKLVKQAISHFWYGISHDIFSEPVVTYAKLAIEALEREKESGATVQGCGHWKIIMDDYDCEMMRCSVCGSEFYDGDNDTVDCLHNYCPHCGSKMMPQPPKVEMIYCKDCEHLIFSDCYGECAKGYKGIVQPNDTCEHARRKLSKRE